MAWGCPRLWSRCDGGTVCYMVIILTVLSRVGVIGPLAVELMTKKARQILVCRVWVLSQGTLPRETCFQTLVRCTWLCLGFLTGTPDLVP